MKKVATNNYKFFNYGSESVDVTRYAIYDLRQKEYWLKDEEERLELLENSLINYSIIKLADFGYDFFEVKDNHIFNLDELLEKINNYIPEKNKKEFFIQYANCIVFLLGKIKNQEQINLVSANLGYNALFITDEYDKDIEHIVVDKNIPAYKLPTVLFDEIRKFNKERVSTLVK